MHTSPGLSDELNIIALFERRWEEEGTQNWAEGLSTSEPFYTALAALRAIPTDVKIHQAVGAHEPWAHSER
ncbi:hypothetical protein SRHO_G00224230 [Serrasalmus rhombeus]